MFIDPRDRAAMVYVVEKRGEKPSAHTTKREAVLQAQKVKGQLYRLHLMQTEGMRELLCQIINNAGSAPAPGELIKREVVHDYSPRANGPATA